MIACVDRYELEHDAKDERIAELEDIVRAKSAMLDEIVQAAGYKRGEQYSVAALIARLRDGDR